MASGFEADDGQDDHPLQICTVPNGKAVTVSKEVYDVATKFGVLPFIVGTVTDTTPAMSGWRGGAVVEFDKIDGIAL